MSLTAGARQWLGLTLMALMFVAVALAHGLRPSQRLADQGPPLDLEALVPQRFGDWQVDQSIVPVLPNGQLQALLDKIYNQTLSRTYVDARGRRIMLSIAYGGDQSDGLALHRPEVCYASQGFHVLSQARGQLDTDQGALPVTRLVAAQGSRVEPITYWVTVGDQAIHSGWREKVAQLGYGLTGRIPDGMLVRTSSIDPDEAAAYALQTQFVQALLASLDPEQRARLAGRVASPASS